jgi:hypothetical protein
MPGGQDKPGKIRTVKKIKAASISSKTYLETQEDIEDFVQTGWED